MEEIDKVSDTGIKELKASFKTFLKIAHPELTHHKIICCEAFYPYRKDIGISVFDIINDNNGIERYRALLEDHFTKKRYKNPRKDSYVYSRAITLLKEFLDTNGNLGITQVYLDRTR